MRLIRKQKSPQLNRVVCLLFQLNCSVSEETFLPPCSIENSHYRIHSRKSLHKRHKRYLSKRVIWFFSNSWLRYIFTSNNIASTDIPELDNRSETRENNGTSHLRLHDKLSNTTGFEINKAIRKRLVWYHDTLQVLAPQARDNSFISRTNLVGRHGWVQIMLLLETLVLVLLYQLPKFIQQISCTTIFTFPNVRVRRYSYLTR
jgi:hypothetical protein